MDKLNCHCSQVPTKQPTKMEGMENHLRRGWERLLPSRCCNRRGCGCRRDVAASDYGEGRCGRSVLGLSGHYRALGLPCRRHALELCGCRHLCTGHFRSVLGEEGKGCSVYGERWKGRWILAQAFPRNALDLRSDDELE